jgi:hypothetical protein
VVEATSGSSATRAIQGLAQTSRAGRRVARHLRGASTGGGHQLALECGWGLEVLAGRYPQGLSYALQLTHIPSTTRSNVQVVFSVEFPLHFSSFVSEPKIRKMLFKLTQFGFGVNFLYAKHMLLCCVTLSYVEYGCTHKSQNNATPTTK